MLGLRSLRKRPRNVETYKKNAKRGTRTKLKKLAQVCSKTASKSQPILKLNLRSKTNFRLNPCSGEYNLRPSKSSNKPSAKNWNGLKSEENLTDLQDKPSNLKKTREVDMARRRITRQTSKQKQKADTFVLKSGTAAKLKKKKKGPKTKNYISSDCDNEKCGPKLRPRASKLNAIRELNLCLSKENGSSSEEDNGLRRSLRIMCHIDRKKLSGVIKQFHEDSSEDLDSESQKKTVEKHENCHRDHNYSVTKLDVNKPKMVKCWTRKCNQRKKIQKKVNYNFLLKKKETVIKTNKHLKTKDTLKKKNLRLKKEKLKVPSLSYNKKARKILYYPNEFGHIKIPKFRIIRNTVSKNFKTQVFYGYNYMNTIKAVREKKRVVTEELLTEPYYEDLFPVSTLDMPGLEIRQWCVVDSSCISKFFIYVTLTDNVMRVVFNRVFINEKEDFNEVVYLLKEPRLVNPFQQWSVEKCLQYALLRKQFNEAVQESSTSKYLSETTRDQFVGKIDEVLDVIDQNVTFETINGNITPYSDRLRSPVGSIASGMSDPIINFSSNSIEETDDKNENEEVVSENNNNIHKKVADSFHPLNAGESKLYDMWSKTNPLGLECLRIVHDSEVNTPQKTVSLDIIGHPAMNKNYVPTTIVEEKFGYNHNTGKKKEDLKRINNKGSNWNFKIPKMFNKTKIVQPEVKLNQKSPERRVVIKLPTVGFKKDKKFKTVPNLTRNQFLSSDKPKKDQSNYN